MGVATGDITLSSGKSMIVYVESPDSITINDIWLNCWNYGIHIASNVLSRIQRSTYVQ